MSGCETATVRNRYSAKPLQCERATANHLAAAGTGEGWSTPGRRGYTKGTVCRVGYDEWSLVSAERLRQGGTYKQPLVEAVARLRPPRDRAERADQPAAANTTMRRRNVGACKLHLQCSDAKVRRHCVCRPARPGCACVHDAQAATPSSVLNRTLSTLSTVST